MDFLKHPKTTILGVLTIICTNAHALALIPAPYTAIAVAVCGTLTGLGLIMAADGKNVETKL